MMIERPKSFWRGLGAAAIYFALFWGIQIGVTLIVTVIWMVNNMITGNAEFFEKAMDTKTLMADAEFGKLTLTALFISSVVTVLAVVLFHFIRRNNPLKKLELNKMSIGSVILSVIAGAAVLIFVEMAVFLIPFPESWQSGFNDAFEGIYKAPMLLVILVIGVIGPICEEVMLRGSVMNVIRRETNPAVAIILSGLLFGLMHGIPLQICYATFIGVVLGIVFHFTKSLWSVIIIHIVNNTASCLSSYWGPYIEHINPWILLAISGVILCACILGMKILDGKRSYSLEQYAVYVKDGYQA